MIDKNEKLITQGWLLAGLAAVAVVQVFMLLGQVDTLDAHSQANFRGLQDELDDQSQTLTNIQNEIRRLQDQRRTADELRLAIQEGMADLRRAAPQPVYVPVQGGAPAPPVQQPARPPQRPVDDPGMADSPPPAVGDVGDDRDDGDSEGEGASEAVGLGTDDDQEALPGPDSDAVVGGTLVQTRTEPSTLNMYTTTEGTTRTIFGYVCEPLFTVSEQDPTKLDRRLAVDWSVAPDKLTITYTLRRGVDWSDGVPFTAHDVKFTYDVIMDENVEAEGHRGAFLAVESVEALDDYTLRVKFKDRYWKGLYVFGNSIRVIPQHWYQARVRALGEERGADYSVNPGEPGFGELFNDVEALPVGTGPYKMPDGGWVRGESLTLERNPNYWRHRAEPGTWNLQNIRWRFISNHTQQLNQTRQQKIDVVVVKRDEWEDSLQHESVITDNYDYHNYDHIGLGYNFIVWNCRKFPFDDARVRRAMTHLIDREGLLRDLWRNNGVVATCMNKPIYPEYNDELEALEYDLERAAELLAAAGFEDLDGDGILDKEVENEDGETEVESFRFKLKIPSGIAEYERLGNRIKESMARVGVELEIHNLEWATFIEDLYAHDFEAASLYNSFSDVWIDNYEDVHSSEDKPRGGNLAGLRMDEIDQLVETARREFDREERIPLYHRLYEILHEQQPYTLLIHGKVNVLLHKRFRNVIVRHAGMRSTYWWVHPDETIY